ncbi:MAG: YggS family pyridoxal phosphate-dependent enzyme [Muricauda sp.]|jgi:pyridoxal phosphate enzyme (YggS family)|nr:YggS family pyridoxal phosphate-dependent enzyme [Allomuricauda sp.]MBO6532161.1 YggS family pyridoxal phosphate-dependent enzyme [Allomuricauda sp.]MBO6589107.1 YggS family pyridoxal phosphate-dependent enzyme [Allomuricauda sp.]MBO6618732.1 YggS family pyridoxal phosphate-dependent enzyme [Allomuricauda sp.]MBO6644645.1 YggS family pyridoxal phosphate-dependent enzyme [Allomuricauda sp.]MBO6746545.1 YggS family pyridoxal phosphate-dependent enzyme [Allomuricauda sp.]
MSVKDNLTKITSELPEGVTLVAVSKTKPNEDILEAYEAGQRIFGENKVQEMVQKWEDLPKDIEWHMIGHVQRNKVKYMAEFVSLIHGVDSPRLLKEINKQAKKHDRVIPCLLQIHIAEEDTKFGLDEKELNELVDSDEFKTMEHIKIVGLMGMATFTEDMDQVRREFAQLKSLYDDLRTKLTDINILSMGMSGDYTVAIEEGSTMVRIGSSIFGARNYT